MQVFAHMFELGCQADLDCVAVNKIIQAQGTMVICAVVEGGLEDSEDEDGEY